MNGEFIKLKSLLDTTIVAYLQLPTLTEEKGDEIKRDYISLMQSFSSLHQSLDMHKELNRDLMSDNLSLQSEVETLLEKISLISSISNDPSVQELCNTLKKEECLVC